MSAWIEYDNGTPVAITWRTNDPECLDDVLAEEHEERYAIDHGSTELITHGIGRLFRAKIVERAPFVGMGCTVLYATDRAAATVIEVVSPTRVRVQLDRSERTDENGMSECQNYAYERDPAGEVFTFVRKRSGAWVSAGRSKTLTLGVRRSYHDYSY